MKINFKKNWKKYLIGTIAFLGVGFVGAIITNSVVSANYSSDIANNSGLIPRDHNGSIHDQDILNKISAKDFYKFNDSTFYLNVLKDSRNKTFNSNHLVLQDSNNEMITDENDNPISFSTISNSANLFKLVLNKKININSFKVLNTDTGHFSNEINISDMNQYSNAFSKIKSTSYTPDNSSEDQTNKKINSMEIDLSIDDSDDWDIIWKDNNTGTINSAIYYSCVFSIDGKAQLDDKGQNIAPLATKDSNGNVILTFDVSGLNIYENNLQPNGNKDATKGIWFIIKSGIDEDNFQPADKNNPSDPANIYGGVGIQWTTPVSTLK